MLSSSTACYYPFGGYRTRPTASDPNGSPITDRGFTGHQSNNEGSNDIGLVYMNARYYAPNTNRWLTPDTIVPDPANLQSYNRYSYVRNNPVNFTDPTGHKEECSPVGGDCAQPLPTWWINDDPRDRVFIEGVGIFEEGHIERGYRSGLYIMEQLTSGNREIELSSGKNYIVTYQIAADIDLANLTHEEMVALAYTMYADFEIGYEAYQGSLGGLQRLSSFSPEDLPSDYVGFWAAVNDRRFDEIPGILESLGPVEPVSSLGVQVNRTLIPNSGGPLPMMVSMVAQNRGFTPMIPVESRNALSVQSTWESTSWPEWMQIPQSSYTVQD